MLDWDPHPQHYNYYYGYEDVLPAHYDVHVLPGFVRKGLFEEAPYNDDVHGI